VPFHFRLWHLADVSALAYVRFAPEAVIRALTEYSRSGGPFCRLKSWTPGKARPWKKRSSDWAVSWLRLKVTPPRPNDPDFEPLVGFQRRRKFSDPIARRREHRARPESKQSPG
jgi:hypothetical protein